MSNEQSSSELLPKKRLRRLKQDPEFIFENPPVERNREKSTNRNDETPICTDLYKPGDIVWSKLGSFPWWPALIYRCDAENEIYTRTFCTYKRSIEALNSIFLMVDSNNKIKRQYFVYFYGKYLEYSWLSTRSLLKYSGLNDFIQNAEQAVQQASTKSEKVELADRYQLKVSMKKRLQWDQAIELADQALAMTREERIKQFSDVLNDVKINKKHNTTRRRKTSIDRTQHSEVSSNKRRNRSSSSFELSTETKSSQIQNNTNAKDDAPIIKKKRGRKPKSALKTNDQSSASANPLIHQNIPPLSNYEQKQIVESLLNHANEKTLTLDEAQTFAIKKAHEIVYENYNYQLGQISSEWFYDSILLKYPSIVFKYRSWFEYVRPNVIPDGTDPIKLKEWQIALMIEAQIKCETNK